MNRKLLGAFLLVVFFGLCFLLLLKINKVEIVHAVVVNAVVQKAPEGYDQERIKKVFGAALERAQAEGTGDRYLDRLQKRFHSLEKRQYLDKDEMDRLLAEFEDAGQR